MPLPGSNSTPGQLEPEFHGLYSQWQSGPTPKVRADLLAALQPDIESAVRRQVGDANPLAVSRGRRMALDALGTYDPNKGKLRTHLHNSLKGMRRVASQQGQVLSVPQRVLQERYALDRAQKELEHTLGREPTDAELMNHTGISAQRLGRLRGFNPAVAEGTLELAMPGSSIGSSVPGVDRRRQVWQEIIYDDLDPYHKKVMELTLGLNGRGRPMANQDIARIMRRSPGAISQAKARIQARLDEYDALDGVL